MIRDALEYLAEQARDSQPPQLVDLDDGRQYSDRKLYELPRPRPKTLSVTTLGALAGFVKEHRAEFEERGAFLLVESPSSVALLTQLDKVDAERDVLMRASALQLDNIFGKYWTQEDLIVRLQTHFVKEVGDLPELLQLVGTITDEEVREQLDDGMKQQVSAKVGIALADMVELPNPVRLRPYRTFRAVEQPESPFVLRARKTAHGVELALFEGDGGAWQLEAMESIQQHLKENNYTIPVLA